LLGVDPDCRFTPAALKKVVRAGARSSSFVEASDDLDALAEMNVSRERIQRWTKHVGEERVAEMEAAAEFKFASGAKLRRPTSSDRRGTGARRSSAVC
jgi:hypothetical protein